MEVISKRISLTAWGRLYGFNKATTSRLHRQGKVMTSLCARLYGKRSARREGRAGCRRGRGALMQATYQTRIEGNDEALSAYAALYGRVQRRLFAEVSSGRSAASMKRGCVREYGIPARMFNAVRVSLEGKVSGARESQLLHIETLKGLVRGAGRELANARKKDDRHGVHQKMRKLDNLRSRLARVEADAAAGLVRLCFGGRKLWRGQYNLEANGYGSHAEWLAGWRDARDGEFFVLGSRDETGGCQLCVAGVAGDGSLTLRLRMPDSWPGSMASTWSSRTCGSPTAMSRCWRPCRPTWSLQSAGAGTAKGRPGQRLWDRQYRTASSGMRRDGGCSSPRRWPPCPR